MADSPFLFRMSFGAPFKHPQSSSMIHVVLDFSGIRFAAATLFVLFVLSSAPNNAQEVVVSEYMNASGPDLEWTELLTVQDNLNMVGWIVHDNNGSQTARQGGVRFKDVPLWRNVRAGTIIVIWHRVQGNPRGTDDDPSDGFLELNLTNTAYFELVKFVEAPNNEMNIAESGDYIQVLRADSSHVHGLGHFARPGGPYFIDAPSPKVNADTSVLGANRTAAVIGRSLLAYNAGVTKDSTAITPIGTLGLPNVLSFAQALTRSNVNHLLWREIREPAFTQAPSITLVSQDARTQTIEWTPVIDPHPTDEVTGVMILRDEQHFAGFDASVIRDGATFTVGQALGSARVVAMYPTKNGSRYVDSDGLTCGGQYSYRIYAYRYGPDHRLTLAQTVDTTARGRQWQTNQWAQSAIIRKPLPPKPVLASTVTSICPGDTVSLIASISDPSSVQFYFWTVDGQPVTVTGTTRITVTQPGLYQLRIVAEGGCEALSDPIRIDARPAGSVAVAPSGSFTICRGDSLALTAGTAAPAYVWTLDGAVIPGATDGTYVARQSGNYQVRILSGQGCPAVSSIVTLRVLDPQFRFEPAVVDFGDLGACESGKTAQTEVVNTGTTPITLTTSVFPVGFTLVSPPAGSVTVPPGGRHPVVVLFSPTGTGVFTGTATVNAQPCSSRSTFTVRGQRTQAVASVNVAQVDFGDFVSCSAIDGVREQRTFTIRNEGSDSLTLQIPNVQPPFYLLPIDNRVVQPGSTVDVVVQYRPLSAEERNRGENQTISFPFAAGGCLDTLRASLQASTFTPSVEFSNGDINVGAVPGCDSIFRGSVTVRNTSAISVTLVREAGPLDVEGVPTTLQPLSEVQLPVLVRLNPGFSGVFNQEATLLVQPCNIRSTVRLRGSVIVPSATIEPPATGFAQVILCDTVQQSTVNARIVVGDGTSTVATITNVSIGAPFATNLRAGDTIRGSRDIMLVYSPTTEGDNATTLRVEIAPCGMTAEIALTGSARSANSTVSTTQIDFGIVPTNVQSNVQDVVVTNTGTLPIRVTNAVVPAPFIITQSNPPLPALLPVGARYTASVAVLIPTHDTPVAETMVVDVDADGLCGRHYQVNLTGRSSEPGVLTGIVLAIPTTARAIAGQEVVVPVELRSDVALTPQDSRPTAVYLSYDAQVMQVMRGQFFGVTGTAVETAPGKALVQMESLVAGSPLFGLVCKTYVAPVLRTNIIIDSIVVQGAVINRENGVLTLEGECDLENRGIGIASGGRLIARWSNGALCMDIAVPTNDATTIQIYNGLGVLQATLFPDTQPGVTSYMQALQELSSGTYWCVLTHGIQRQTVSVIVVR
jgi:hypothetical protein